MAALWDRVVDLLWSLAAALLPEDEAIEALSAVRVGYGQRLPGLPMNPSWRDALLGLLWGEIAARLEPRALAGILKDVPPMKAPAPSGGEPPPPGAQARVCRALREAPAELRMVYLFSTLGGQSASAMAAYSGFPERDVRAARARVAWLLARAMRGES
ncbi:MAG: hypothetical protein H6740_04275 [Alphaproteobacteria bacterium]|nr:hypothetical protein [Alphaproteobacteria bacterium]